MNAQKYTQNSLAAIEAAKSLTLEHQNQTMEPCHILYALLAQEKGLIPQLIEKLGASASALRMDAESAIDALPSVTGSGREADRPAGPPRLRKKYNTESDQWTAETNRRQNLFRR